MLIVFHYYKFHSNYILVSKRFEKRSVNMRCDDEKISNAAPKVFINLSNCQSLPSYGHNDVHDNL